MSNELSRGMSRVAILIVGIAALGGVLILLAVVPDDPSVSSGDPHATSSGASTTESIDTSSWRTYADARYDVTLRYPASWRVATTANGIAPMITVFKPGSTKRHDPPYDHFANATHVSLYPDGIPTEGLFGERGEFSLDLALAVKDATTYVLRDETPFAAMVTFVDMPDSWGPAGFVWARVRVESLETECLRDGAVISDEQCDPLFGDVVTRSGTLSREDWRVVLAILKSLRFPTDGVQKQSEQPETPARGVEDMLRVTSPQTNEVISSPLRLEGAARGPWYFEGSFPVELYDASGLMLAQIMVPADGEWMTDEFVDFSAEISFEEPQTETGTLVLKRANPSGNIDQALEKRITIVFDDYTF